MKAVVLAAGYATRLYPLTENQPKPLLQVAGKTILDYSVEKLDRIDELDEIIIVTNDKFAGHFKDWADRAQYSKKLQVVNDGTLTNDSRLGALGDVEYVIDQLHIKDDLLVIAGDNIFEFEFTELADFFKEKGSSVIAAYREENLDQLKRSGIAELDSQGKVLSFEEKPNQPKSNFSVPALYIYHQRDLGLLDQYLKAGNNPDAPGHFIPYLIQQSQVYAYIFEGKRYDIGTLESYQRVQTIFDQR